MRSTAELETDWIRDVLEEYQGALTRYAMRITGDLEKARDVVQDTFLQLCRQEPARIEGHLAQWLYTVCRNRALDVKRRESRMTVLQEVDGFIAVDQAKSPAQQVETREMVTQVLTALNQLTPNQQEVIRLKFQDGLGYREIGQITGLSTSKRWFSDPHRDQETQAEDCLFGGPISGHQEGQVMTIDRNDPRLTAYVLNELDQAEKAEVEAALQESEELRREVEKIRQACGLLGESLLQEPDVELKPEQIEQIEKAVRPQETTRPGGSGPGFPWPLRFCWLRFSSARAGCNGSSPPKRCRCRISSMPLWKKMEEAEGQELDVLGEVEFAARKKDEGLADESEVYEQNKQLAQGRQVPDGVHRSRPGVRMNGRAGIGPTRPRPTRVPTKWKGSLWEKS